MFTLNCKGRLLVVEKPMVMGIINVTPDSFYSGSRYANLDEVLRKAEQMLTEGASLLDIGGQSTRPGSERISMEEEMNRVIQPVEAIIRRFPESIISIDTYYSRIARDAVNAGASLINDVSAGTLDPDMIPTAVALQVPYVLMHMKGRPETMQHDIHYNNVTMEVLDFFIKKIAELKSAGMHDIIIDPGFGFGKNISNNFELLKNLRAFSILSHPLLLGISRKSTIYRTLGVTAEESLNGTTVLHTIGLMNGASILRAHDVKEAIETIRLWEACMQ